MERNTDRRADLILKIMSRIAERLQRVGMSEPQAVLMACRDMRAAHHVGLRKVHGVSIAKLLS